MANEANNPATPIGEAAPTTVAQRTTAMWLVPIAGVIEVLIAIRVLTSRLIPPLVVFSVLLTITTILVVLRRRPWTYLVGGIALGFTTAFSSPFIVGALLKPVETDHQADGIVTVVVGIVGAIAGIAAFVESRRSAPTVPALRAPLGELLATLVAGALIGAVYITLVAYAEVKASPGAGVVNGVSAAPTQAPVELTAKAAKFIQHDLAVKAGDGTVYVVNKDNAEHTFDIDLKGKHYSYPVPANSTVGVVLNFDAGAYTYYCAISGHRANGMEGKLTAS